MPNPDAVDAEDGTSPDPIAAALRSLPVAAPVDDWEGLARRGRRRQRRTRLAAVAASVLVVLAVAGVVAVVADRPGGDGPLPVQAGDPTTVPTVDPEADVATVTWPPVAEDDRLVLVPPGPYAGGQEVVLDGPEELFDVNDVPQLCAVVDGREACDPLWSSTVPFDVIRGNGPGVRLPLRRWVFTPTGWHDCGAPAVTCRIVQHGWDGGNRATGRLDFTGEPGAPPELTVGDGGVVSGPPAEAATTVLGPAGLGPAARITADAAPLAGGDALPAESDVAVSLCRFLPPPMVERSSILPSDCEAIATYPQGTGPIDTTVPVPRSLYGFAGWHDCADGHCFVMARRGTLDGQGMLLAGGTGAAGLVRFASDVADRPRPQLRLEPPGPYADQQVVTVVGSWFPPERLVDLGQCHPGDPADGTDPWGHPWEDCRYTGGLSVTVGADGTFRTQLPLVRQHLVLGLPDTGIDCAAQPPGTCYLGYTPGKGNAEPMASTPLAFTP